MLVIRKREYERPKRSNGANPSIGKYLVTTSFICKRAFMIVALKIRRNISLQHLVATTGFSFKLAVAAHQDQNEHFIEQLQKHDEEV